MDIGRVEIDSRPSAESPAVPSTVVRSAVSAPAVPSTLVSTPARVLHAWRTSTNGARCTVAVAVAMLALVGRDTGHDVGTIAASALVVVGTLTSTAALVDHVEMKIPNRLLAVAACSTVGLALADGVHSVLGITMGMLAAAIPMVAVLLSRGIGIGDVKLGAVLGAAAGFIHPYLAVATIVAAATTSATYGLVTRRSRVALGPWMVGSWLAVLSVASFLDLGRGW